MNLFANPIKLLFSRRASETTCPTRPGLDPEEIVPLDAEELAEQGILSAYRRLLPRLQRYAAKAVDVTEHINSDTGQYAVTAGEKRYPIWDFAGRNEDAWERATVAFFQIVNAGLVDSEHRFYALHGGNDLSGIFLAGPQFKAARKSIAQPANWPWLPVNEPPHYGYPVDGSAS